MSEMYPTDQATLLVFGQNWENYKLGFIRKKHGTPRHINKHSRETAEAATIVLNGGNYKAVIVTTGHTNGPHQPAESDPMANIIESHKTNRTRNIPIFRERISTDTPENIHESLKLMTALGLQGPIDIVAPYYHLPRIELTATGLGMEIRHKFPTEKVLGRRRYFTPIWEYPLRILARIDPEGTIPRKLWTHRRGR